jgi:hypothetical protein
LKEILKLYLKIAAIICLVLGVHQEVMVKGTFVNRQIRHYFGLNYFVEYSSGHLEDG